MKILSIVVLILTFTWFSFSSNRPAGPYIESRKKIEINAYDSSTSAFEVTDLADYGQGPFFATAENLRKALPGGVTLDQLLLDPQRYVGKRFDLQTDLPVMQFFEHEALKQEFKQRRKRYNGF